VFLGAAENPNVSPVEHRAVRLAKKIAAGAQFVQTQYCYDIPLLRRFMTAVEDAGLLDQVFILIGVGPLRTARTGEWMRKNVPGIHIPDSVIERLKGAQDQTREGLKLCVDLIQEVRTIKGVNGVHVMAYRQEESVAEVIDRSGILAGRTPWFPGRDTQINEDRKLS
jgi:methylenetetrahydrofolate reductase (NADPH)